MLCMIPGVKKSITFRDIRDFLHSHHIYLYHIVVYFLRFIAYCLLLILLMHVSVISLTSYLICVGERKYLNEILYLYISLQYTNVLYSFYEYLSAQAELKIIIQ